MCEIVLSWSIIVSIIARLREPQLVRHMYELVLHVFAQPSDELESVFKEQSSQGSRDIAAIPKQLAPQMFDHLGNRLPVIHIAGSQTTSQQITAVVDRLVQFKAIKPAHRRLATPGIRGKDPMVTDPLGITDGKRGGIDKTDPGAGSKSALAGSHQQDVQQNRPRRWRRQTTGPPAEKVSERRIVGLRLRRLRFCTGRNRTIRWTCLSSWLSQPARSVNFLGTRGSR